MEILYLPHVCWEWIFQRPQILALLLENDNECTVLNRKYILRRVTTKNNKKPKKMKLAYQLPKAHVIPTLNYLNKAMYKMALWNCDKYDAIWVCHPELFEFVPKSYKGKIIYDCMDNHVAMARPDLKDSVAANEQALIKRADVVFVSSQKLKEVVPNLQDAVLVRNGFVLNKVYDIRQQKIKESYKLGYIGTVSSWFDFELLESSLKDINGIEYHLIGPKEPAVAHINYDAESKIVFDGVVEHSKLYEHIKDFDALMMPFKINDIILSVDPVKLYEYICFGQCIISVWYPEIDRFSPYVYFYRNKEEYVQLIQDLSVEGFPPKYNVQQQSAFLRENSWEERYEVINDTLEKL